MNTNPTLNIDDPILRISDVERSTGLKRSTIYAFCKQKKFPSPIKLGSRSSGFLQSEVNQWKAERIAASRKDGDE